MSSIHNRIVTTFTGQAGQAVAVMGEVSSGMLGVGRSAYQSGNQIGYAERQLRAFGTTFRYALAGTAIFALPNMVRNFTELSNRLGDIAAIATTTGGIPIVGHRLDDLRDRLLAVSVDTAQPIDNLTEGVTRLYSTLNDVPPNRAAEMMRVIAEVANTSQSNVTDTTDAILGMMNAFGQGPDKLKAFGNAFRTVIRESAGMTGEMFSQSAGRLFQTGRLGEFSPATLFGTAIAATRFGGSQTSNINNLAQMLLYVMQPPQKNAERALAGIGLPSTVRRRIGGDETFRRVLAEVNRRGFASNPRFLRLSDDALGDLGDQSPMGTSGRGAELLQQIFPRIQGRRIAAIMATLSGGQPGKGNKSLQQYITDSQNALNNANQLDQANARAMQPRRFQQAAEAMHNFGIEVGIAMEPLLRFGASGLTGFERLMARHHHATQIGLYGLLGGVAGASLLRSMGRMGGGAGLPGRLFYRLRQGGGVLAATGELSGAIQPRGTPDAPFFVWVLNQGGKMLFNKPGAATTVAEEETAAGRRFRLPPALPLGIGAASAGVLLATPGAQGPTRRDISDWMGQHYPWLRKFSTGQKGLTSNMDWRAIPSPGAPDWAVKIMQQHSVGIANRMIRDIIQQTGPRIRSGHFSAAGGGPPGALGPITMSGMVELDIIYNQPDGKKSRRRVHVRVDNWGSGNVPQHRGKNKSQRR